MSQVTEPGNERQGTPRDPRVADPPIRIKALLDEFPNRSAFTSICQQDLSGGLQQIGALLKTALGDPCIQGVLADTDPKTPVLSMNATSR
ncbi:MAG TPA: hypothetical protein VF469_15045 [Kofleriaceae bacterium]